MRALVFISLLYFLAAATVVVVVAVQQEERSTETPSVFEAASTTRLLGKKNKDKKKLDVLHYTETLALKAAYLSSAAYELDPECSNWTFPNSKCRGVLPDYAPASSFGTGYGLGDSAFAFVGVQHGGDDWGRHAEGAIVVAFKGTSNLPDWVADLSTWLRFNYPCILGDEGNSTTNTTTNAVNLGMVHHGFCEYYRELDYYGLGQQIANLADAHPHHRVFLTGHSLGGAAATVAAADMAQRFGVSRERIVLFTFGAPRVGDADFANMLNASVGSIFRIVHRRDIVPHLPPCCHDWRGRCTLASNCPLHAAVEVYYDNAMKDGDTYILCSDVTGEDTNCDKAINLSILDHIYYFDIRVGGWCGISDAQIAAGVGSQEEPLPPELRAEALATEEDEHVEETKEFLAEKALQREWWREKEKERGEGGSTWQMAQQ